MHFQKERHRRGKVLGAGYQEAQDVDLMAVTWTTRWELLESSPLQLRTVLQGAILFLIILLSTRFSIH